MNQMKKPSIRIHKASSKDSHILALKYDFHEKMILFKRTELVRTLKPITNPSHSEGPKLLDMLMRKEDGKVILCLSVGCKLWK